METTQASDISPQQAAEALQDVENVTSQTRGKLAYKSVGPALILWGVILATCYSMTYFVPRLAGWAWAIGDSIGLLAIAMIAIRDIRRGPVRSEATKREAKKEGWSWFALFIFAGIWVIVLCPWSGDQLGIFLVTLVMFAYVMMGLWQEMWFMVWLGVIVTALAVGGYFGSMFLPGYLSLWMAGTAGGAFLISGVYLTRKWG